MKSVDVAILGAGVAGLGASMRASEIGREAVLFESRHTAGGLLDNFMIKGFRFDHAVHLSFATEPEVREIFDRTPYITHPADSACHEGSVWMKHPVQNNLYPLPPEEKVALIESFVNRPEMTKDNYEGWLRHQYGDLIAERYPLRYTQKYWDTDASGLSTTWIGNRMRRAKLSEVLYGAFSADTPNTYYTKEMRYPEKGGYKSFIAPLIEQADIRCDHEVTGIDLERKTLQFSNGNQFSYSKLVSTLPLPIIIGLLSGVPPEVDEAASELKATSVDLISVAFNKEVMRDLWFYIYDEDIYASRAYSPSVKSPDNAPRGCSSIQFEIYSRGESSRYTKDELVANTYYALDKLGICSKNDIYFVDHRRIRYGNVIFDTGMEGRRSLVLNYLKSFDVASCGRFGAWDYLWSNQSLLSGYHAL